MSWLKNVKLLTAHGYYNKVNEFGSLTAFDGKIGGVMRKYCLYAIFVCLVCMVFGCAQSLPKTSAEVQNRIINWEVDTVNPLLTYVPDDAPVVLATRRVYGENSAAFDAVLERWKSIAVIDVNKAYRGAFNSIDRGSYDFYWYDDDDEDEDDEIEENDDIIYSSVEIYEQQQQELKERQERKERRAKIKDLKTKYNLWKTECSPFGDYDGDDNQEMNFEEAYEKITQILKEENCESNNASSCGCRLKEFKQYGDDEDDIIDFEYDHIVDNLEYYKSSYESYRTGFLDSRDSQGLRSLATQDAVAYFVDSHVVFQFGVLDEKKVLDELDKRIHDNGDELFDDKIKREDKRIDDKNWIFYTSVSAKKDKLILGMHGENNVVTVTLFVNEEEFPSDILTPKSNPFKPSLFGNVPQNSIATGRVDLQALGRLFTSTNSNNTPGVLAGLFDEEINKKLEYLKLLNDYDDEDYDDEDYDDEDSTSKKDDSASNKDDIPSISISDDICQREIRELFSETPYITGSLTLNEKGGLSIHAYQKLSPDLTKQVGEMVPEHSVCSVPEDDARLELGVKPVVLWSNLKQYVQNHVDKNYQCPAVRYIVNSTHSGIKNINEDIFEDIKYLPIASNFNSLSLVIHNIEEVTHFARLEIDRLLDYIIPLLKKEADLNLKEGVAEKIDISRKLGNAKVMYKGNTLVEGTHVEEVDSICHVPEKDRSMLSIGVSKRLIKYIDSESSSRDGRLSDIFKYNIQLYTRPETDGFSIHLEEFE